MRSLKKTFREWSKTFLLDKAKPTSWSFQISTYEKFHKKQLSWAALAIVLEKYILPAALLLHHETLVTIGDSIWTTDLWSVRFVTFDRAMVLSKGLQKVNSRLKNAFSSGHIWTESPGDTGRQLLRSDIPNLVSYPWSTLNLSGNDSGWTPIVWPQGQVQTRLRRPGHYGYFAV